MEILLLLHQHVSGLSSPPFYRGVRCSFSTPFKSHPISSCSDHCGDREDRERGARIIFSISFMGVPLPRLDTNVQARPHQCLQCLIPTIAAHAAHGLRGNTTWSIEGWFLSLRGASHRGIWGSFPYLLIYLSP